MYPFNNFSMPRFMIYYKARPSSSFATTWTRIFLAFDSKASIVKLMLSWRRARRVCLHIPLYLNISDILRAAERTRHFDSSERSRLVSLSKASIERILNIPVCCHEDEARLFTKTTLFTNSSIFRHFRYSTSGRACGPSGPDILTVPPRTKRPRLKN